MPVITKYILRFYILIQLAISSSPVFAASQGLGSVADNMTSTMGSLSQFIQGMSFVIGFGFGVGAIVKYKAHRDNPLQVRVTEPITLLFISLAFLCLGVVLTLAGQSIFGSGAETGTAVGTTNFS